MRSPTSPGSVVRSCRRGSGARGEVFPALSRLGDVFGAASDFANERALLTSGKGLTAKSCSGWSLLRRHRGHGFAHIGNHKRAGAAGIHTFLREPAAIRADAATW
jgi:hypothetical protein